MYALSQAGLDGHQSVTDPCAAATRARTDVDRIKHAGQNNGGGQTWTASNGTLNTDGGAYCLTVKNASTSRGAAVILYQCSSGSNQQWSGS